MQHALRLRVREQTREPRGSCCCNTGPPLCCPWATSTSIPSWSHCPPLVGVGSQLRDQMSLPLGRQLLPFNLPAPSLWFLFSRPHLHLPHLSPFVSLSLYLCPIHVNSRMRAHVHTHIHTVAYCHHPFSNSLPSAIEFTLPGGQDHDRWRQWITCCKGSKGSKGRPGHSYGPLGCSWDVCVLHRGS